MFTYLRHHQNVGSGVSQCMFHPMLGAKSKDSVHKRQPLKRKESQSFCSI